MKHYKRKSLCMYCKDLCPHTTIQILLAMMSLESCAARAKFSKIGLNLNIHPYLMDLQT